MKIFARLFASKNRGVYAVLGLSLFLPQFLGVSNANEINISGGTIVVLAVSQDYAVLGADSRERHLNSEDGKFLPPNDKVCKISALSEHFAFAASGNYAAIGTEINVFKISRDAFSASQDVDSMVQYWSRAVIAGYQHVLTHVAEDKLFRDVPENEPRLITGYFVSNKNGVAAQVVDVFYNRETKAFRTSSMPVNGIVASSGDEATTDEFIQLQSIRSKAAQPIIPQDSDETVKQVLVVDAIVRAAIDWAAPDSGVGGLPNIALLERNRSLRWYRHPCIATQ